MFAAKLTMEVGDDIWATGSTEIAALQAAAKKIPQGTLAMFADTYPIVREGEKVLPVFRRGNRWLRSEMRKAAPETEWKALPTELARRFYPS